MAKRGRKPLVQNPIEVIDRPMTASEAARGPATVTEVSMVNKMEMPDKRVLADTGQMKLIRIDDGRFHLTVAAGNVRRQIEGKGQSGKWEFLLHVCENGANTFLKPGALTHVRLVSVDVKKEADGTEITKIKPLDEIEL